MDVARSNAGDNTLVVAGALDVLVRALVLNGRGANAETRTLAEQALRITEANVGSQHVGLVDPLLNLGDVLVATGEFDAAVAVTQRALTLRQAGAPRGGPEVADALDHLGRAWSAARKYDDALKVFQESLALKQQRLGSTDVAIARTLEDITLVLQRRGEYEEAGVRLRRAVAIQEGSDALHPAYATTLNLLAQQLWFEGDLLGSKAASERAVAIAEQSLRSDHPTIALSLRYLANTLTDLGDLEQSFVLTKRALAIAEGAFGPRHHVTAEYVHSLGLAELGRGEYSAARAHLREALSIYTTRYGEWHELVATAHSVIALASARLGDYGTALREQSLAVAIHSRVGGANHPFVALALTELATVYNEEGRAARALPLLQRALRIRETNLGAEHRDVARTLVDLAATLAAVGQPARAQRLATRALRIWERLDAPDAPGFATVLALYAKLQADRGDAAAAKSYYERALQIRGRVFGTAHPLYAEAQTGLAAALAALGDRPGALSVARQAEASGRDHLHVMLRSLPERQALQYAAARPRGLNVIFSLASSTPDAVPVALDGLVRSRALVLDEIAARHSVEQASDRAGPAGLAMSSAQQRLANLLVRGPGQMSAAQYATLVDAARQEAEAAEQTLAERSATFRAERSRANVGASDVVAALPADAALVAFARYDRTIQSRASTAPTTSASARPPPRAVPSYLAFVMRPGQPPMAVPLGSVQGIDMLVSQWRTDIAAEALAPPTTAATPARTSRASGTALRQRVWDRVAGALGNAHRVFIVPDGALSLVPFAALPVAQRSYLLERGPIIHYLSAERDLAQPPRNSDTSHGLLAIGGPSFNDATLFRGRLRPSPPARPSNVAAALRGPRPCGGFDTISFQPLAGTRQEVRDLSAVWNANVAAPSDPARVLTGRDASEAAFKREAVGFRVLHLATHGFFLNGDCAPAPSGTRGVGGLATAGRRNSVENPLLLSGLALAGANRRASAGPDEDDGILTAEEVASLDLDGVEWAVLSACDTGVGEIRAGEGVFGLRRAFQVAGARTVVMSLWSVDDQATRAWMRALYEGRFQRKLSTADAVHQASLSMLRDRRAKGLSTHPFYWAAFVAAGDWR